MNASLEAFGRINEKLIADVVEDFYQKARQDPELGPVFAAHVEDWGAHLETMRKFWATVLLGGRAYSGNPFQKHLAVGGLSAEHFRRWLELFSQTLAKHCTTADAAQWETTARRMGFAMSSRLGFLQIDDLLR